MEIILLIAIILIICIVLIYNKIVNLKTQMKNASSAVDVYLKQRFDLVPNLVECINGVKEYESETLTKLVELRNQYLNKINLEQAVDLNNEYSKQINLLVENYPNIKSNENFLELQKTLVKLEDQIQAARRFYNSSVEQYNISISTVPSNIVAVLFGFKQENFYKAEDEEKNNINIEV